MQRTQHKFNSQAWYDDVWNFTKDYTLIGSVVKTFEGDKTESKNPVLKAGGSLINELNPVEIKNGSLNLKTPDVFGDALKVGREIEQDIKIIGDDMLVAGKYIENVAVDAYDIGKGLYKFVGNGVWFVETYYKVILFGGAVYVGARFYNEVKQTVK